MAGRIRGCVACGISDDHPRHVISVGGASVPFHMDCHAATGCEVCAAQIADADGVQGDELRTHLIALGEEARHG
jgi:hypothetical protein